MAGLTIIDVKIVGMCSKHRQEGDEIQKDKYGRVYEDKEISCVGCMVGGKKKRKIPNYEDKVLTLKERIALKKKEWLKIKNNKGGKKQHGTELHIRS